MKKRKTVLFICTHNSARSQIAEALLNSKYGDKFSAVSAGTKPTKISPYAIRVMAEAGLDVSGSRSKNVSEFKDKKFEYLITVCDNAKESCPYFPDAAKVIHAGFANPSEFQGSDRETMENFRVLRDLISDWLDKFASGRKEHENNKL